jgi:hypothetical protein
MYYGRPLPVREFIDDSAEHYGGGGGGAADEIFVDGIEGQGGGDDEGEGRAGGGDGMQVGDDGDPDLPERQYVRFPEDEARESRERQEEAADAHAHGLEGGAGALCPVCHFGDDMGAQANGGPHAELLRFEARNLGRMHESVIYQSMLDARRREIEGPLLSQGEQCARWSLTALRTHYRSHQLNIVRQLSDDIEYCAMVQRHLRRQGVLQRDRRTGLLGIDHKGLDGWIKLSRQKTTLCKELVTARTAADAADGGLPEGLASKKRKGADGLSVLATNATRESTNGVNFYNYND